MSTSPLVSIISVNYNEPEVTMDFLKSLYSSGFSDFETIIVDNGSKDKLSPEIEKNFKNLTYIFSEKNLGFAGGNNLGVAIAKGKYLFFLNNDTLIPVGCLTKMVDFFAHHPDAGAATPKIKFTNGKIQYAGSTRINPFTGRGKRKGLREDDWGQYDKNYETDLAHGAAMMIPKKVIDVVGYMYEAYFLYYEELDWCMRIKNKGYKIYYIGETSITHRESMSVGIDSPLKAYYMSRNRIMYQKRNTSGITKICGILFYCLIGGPKLTIKYALLGKKSQLRNLWRGIFWHVNNRYVFKG